MRQSFLIAIGAGALLIIILAGYLLIGPLQRQRTAPGVPTQTQAPSVEDQGQLALTLTPIPTEQTAQSRSVPATPTLPAAAPPATLQSSIPLLYDDFSQMTSGWTPLFVSPELTVNGYSTESFAVSTASPGKLFYTMLPTQSFAPTRYSVEIEPVEGTGMFGLMIEAHGDQADYNSQAFSGVGLTTDGNVILLIKNEGTAAEVQVLPIPQHTISPLTTGTMVRLGVDRHADRITIYVDGAEVFTVMATAQQSGMIGFFARADDRLAVHFDNLLLTAGARDSQLPCAQLRPLIYDSSRAEAVQGDEVVIVQRRLTQLGYNPQQSGIYNDHTMQAIMQFQSRNNLPAHGGVDAQTWCRLLSSEAVLAHSDQTERVRLRERYPSVALSLNAELPVPLLVSVRGAERQWQIALALPGRVSLHYIDTGGDALDAVWQPDQGLLAFTSVRADKDQNTIWLYDSATGQVKQISPASLDSQYPSWSPDGRALMFTAVPMQGEKKARNYTYTLATGEITAWGDEKTGWSDWSPVGTVAFTRLTDHSFDIFAANPDGSGAINLTNTDDYHEDIPAWSPHGDRIAFVRNPKSDSNNRQICIMQADGSDIQQITSLPMANSNPIWLDQKTIIFANQRSDDANDHVRQPYLLRLPGDLRRLSMSEERIWYVNRFELKK